MSLQEYVSIIHFRVNLILLAIYIYRPYKIYVHYHVHTAIEQSIIMGIYNVMDSGSQLWTKLETWIYCHQQPYIL